MKDNKSKKFSEIYSDVLFALSVFYDGEQDEYLKKHKRCLSDIKIEIESKINTNIVELARLVAKTDLLTKSTLEILNNNKPLIFLKLRGTLEQKKQELNNAIKHIEVIIEKINRLPQEKSDAFCEKISKLLNWSIFPIGNVLIISSITKMIKEFIPALTSNNSSYMSLRHNLINKFQLFLYVHLLITMISAGVSFVVTKDTRLILYALASIYMISSVFLKLKEIQLKKMGLQRN